MNDDKITAMWEEDGDLMRIKEFFAYIHQDANLKDRIKQKTLAKITAEQNPADQSAVVQSTVALSIPDDAQAQSTINLAATEKKDTTSKWKNVKGRLLSGRTWKGLTAAAVVIFAVYLGSTGLLMDGKNNMPFGFGSAAQKSADNATQERGFGGLTNGAAPTAPAAPPSPAPTIKGEMMDQGATAYDMDGAERNALLQEKGIASTGSTFSEPQTATNEAVADTIEQKIIYVLELSLKSDDVPASVKALEEKVKAAGGYIAESRQNNYENKTTAFLSLRVPADQFNSFKGDLAQYGIVENEHLYTDDVSRQYFDVQSRLRSWEAQEKRYLEILQQAKTVEDILKIEDSLANVRREMESLKGQLKYWDNKVQYSEIRINIYPTQTNLNVNDPWQPVSLESTFTAAKNAVIKTISFIWNALNYLIVFVGYLIPVAVVLLIAWLVYRYWKRKKAGN